MNSVTHKITQKEPQKHFIFVNKANYIYSWWIKYIKKIKINYFISTFRKITVGGFVKVSKGAKIVSRYNQVPHLTQDTNGKVTKSQLDTTNESQEVSPFPAGDHKAHKNRRVQT